MKQLRHPAPDDPRWVCQANRCQEISVIGWARVIPVDDEHPDGGTTAVEACATHAIDDLLAGHVHQAECQAPPVCTCKTCPPECHCQQPEPFARTEEEMADRQAGIDRLAALRAGAAA